MLVQVVENDLRLDSGAKLHDHAHAVSVGLVANFCDALNAFGLDQSRNLLHEGGFVDLVRQFVDDYLHTIRAFHRLDFGFRSHDDLSPPGCVGVADSLTAHDCGAGGKIRPSDVAHELF